MKYQEIREAVVKYSQQMFNEGLVNATSGNISIRVPDIEGGFAITPSGENYLTMTPDRVVVMTIDGTVVDGPADGKPSSEWRLHAAAYRDKADVNAVVHTHSPYATAFATANKPIPLSNLVMIPFFGGPIEVAPFGPNGSWELAENSIKTMKDRGAALMLCHGVVAVGKDINHAYKRATYVEDVARIILLSKVIGTPVELG